MGVEISNDQYFEILKLLKMLKVTSGPVIYFFYLQNYFFIFFVIINSYEPRKKAGIQNLERSNVERPIFRNLKITNIKTAKDELFDYFIYEFIFYFFFNYLNTKSI